MIALRHDLQDIKIFYLAYHATCDPAYPVLFYAMTLSLYHYIVSIVDPDFATCPRHDFL